MGDEPVIARALAKAPEERFGSCREMIECLQVAMHGERRKAPRPARPTATIIPERSETEVLSPETLLAARAAAACPPVNKTQVTETPTPARDLPPLELEASQIVLRPTLFVGVGGMAVHALTALHARIEARFGDPAALPALQFLLFDTDADSFEDRHRPASRVPARTAPLPTRRQSSCRCGPPPNTAPSPPAASTG